MIFKYYKIYIILNIIKYVNIINYFYLINNNLIEF